VPKKNNHLRTSKDRAKRHTTLYKAKELDLGLDSSVELKNLLNQGPIDFA